MIISEDSYIEFLKSKGFSMDRSGYYFIKIDKVYLNCYYGIDPYINDAYYRVVVTDNKGCDLVSKKYYDWDDFRSSIVTIIRESRFKILLDK